MVCRKLSDYRMLYGIEVFIGDDLKQGLAMTVSGMLNRGNMNVDKVERECLLLVIKRDGFEV